MPTGEARALTFSTNPSQSPVVNLPRAVPALEKASNKSGILTSLPKNLGAKASTAPANT